MLMITPLPRSAHRPVDLAREVDAAEHLEVPGAPPFLLVDLEQRAARNAAGAVDQNVDVRAQAAATCFTCALSVRSAG